MERIKREAPRWLLLGGVYIAGGLALFLVLMILIPGGHAFLNLSVFTPAHPGMGYHALELLAFLAQSLKVAGLAAGWAGFLGVAGAVFVVRVAPVAWRRWLLAINEFWFSLPTVVYGWAGLILVIPALDSFATSVRLAVVLGMMILPTVLGLSVAAIGIRPGPLEMAAVALGASQWEAVWFVLRPAVQRQLAAAVLVGLLRAFGEAAVVYMFLGPSGTLASEILSAAVRLNPTEPVPEGLFLAALLLAAVSWALTLLTRRLLVSYKASWS